MACINSGVYRSDIPTTFKVESEAYQHLIDRVADTVDFAIQIEGGMNPDDILNKEEVVRSVQEKLIQLRDHPSPASNRVE